MYDRQTDKFTHYDSSSGSNRRAGQQIARKVEPYLKGKSKEWNDFSKVRRNTQIQILATYLLLNVYTQRI